MLDAVGFADVGVRYRSIDTTCKSTINIVIVKYFIRYWAGTEH